MDTGGCYIKYKPTKEETDDANVNKSNLKVHQQTAIRYYKNVEKF